MEIGQKLKDARARTGLTQETVAEKIGVSRQSVSNWENNRSYPDIASVLKLSDLYCVSLDELLKEDEKMKQHIEDNSNWLKKYCNLLCDSGFVLAILSNIFKDQGWNTAALVFGLIALLVAILPRIVYVKSFGTSPKLLASHCIVWSMWILGNLAEIWLAESIIVSLVCTAGFWGILIVRYREYQNRERKHAPWFMFSVVVLIEVISLFAFGFNMLYSVGDKHEVNPFSHYYKVEEVLYGSEGAEIPSQVRLDFNDGLKLMDESLEYSDIGTFSYAALTEGEQSEGLKGLWRLTPEDAPNELYKLTVEADESVVLAHYIDDTLRAKYLLTRVDTLFVQVNSFGSLMTTQPTWYQLGAWRDSGTPGGSYAIPGEAEIVFGFHTDPPENLILYEEYHNGEQIDYNEYLLQPNEDGVLTIELSTRYPSENPYTTSGQYAVYRIPYKDGEYIFTLKYD